MTGASSRVVTHLAPVVLIACMWFVITDLDLALGAPEGIHSVHAIATSLSALLGIPLSIGLYALTLKAWQLPPRMARPIVVVLIAIAGTTLWIANTLFQAWFSGHTPIGAWPGDWMPRLRTNWMYFTALFVLQTLAFLLFDAARNLRARERQLVEAKLAALRFQLNPHFLFNTLNAISTLVAEGRATEAEQMLGRLSLFLRASFSEKPTELVTLAVELDMVQAYLDIESVRFGDRLDVRYACDSGLTDAMVPSLILQPLVENAVKYAVAPATSPVTITIEARRCDQELNLIVEDNGRHAPPAQPKGTGVGLRNISSRIDALYGSKGRLEVLTSEGGFTAVIRLPLTWSTS